MNRRRLYLLLITRQRESQAPTCVSDYQTTSILSLVIIWSRKVNCLLYFSPGFVCNADLVDELLPGVYVLIDSMKIETIGDNKSVFENHHLLFTFPCISLESFAKLRR